MTDPTWKLSVRREHYPLTNVEANTLHTLQGTTADPGLIMHWSFPRRVSKQLRWLATYVALSRPRSLAQLRSIGLTAAIRAIIEEGPPKGLLTRFQELFETKIAETELAAVAALEELGWASAGRLPEL